MKIKTRFTVLLLLMLMIFGCGKKEEPLIRPVEIEKAIKIPTILSYEYPGIIISENEAPLGFLFGGKIVKMNVEIGSLVKKGDVIAEVMKRDYETNYIAAKAVSDNAIKQFKRVSALYKAKAIPKKSYDEVVADVEVAKQAANFAKSRLEETVIKAPYDGYITKKFLGKGAVADPGVPVVSISSIGESMVRISVSEDDINNLENLEKAVLTYEGKDYKLTLSDIGKSKGTLRLAYPVTFKIEDEKKNLLIDSSGIVKVYFKNKNFQDGILVPVESLFEKKEKVRVWLYDKEEQKVYEKVVKVIKPYSDGEVIVEGVKDGEEIVTKGVHELIEGQKVNVVEPFSKTNVGEML